MKIYLPSNLSFLTISKSIFVALAVILLSMPVYAQDVPTKSNPETNKHDSQIKIDEAAGTKHGGSSSAPQQEQKSNSQIGPPDSDQIVMEGVKGAKTVRVNNLATIEFILTFLANASEIVLPITGMWMLIRALLASRMSKSEQKGVNWRLALWGLALIVLGLSIPATINWFVSSDSAMSRFS